MYTSIQTHTSTQHQQKYVKMAYFHWIQTTNPSMESTRKENIGVSGVGKRMVGDRIPVTKSVPHNTNLRMCKKDIFCISLYDPADIMTIKSPFPSTFLQRPDQVTQRIVTLQKGLASKLYGLKQALFLPNKSSIHKFLITNANSTTRQP